MLILCMLKDLYLSYFTTGLTYNIQHFSYTSQALSSLFSLFLILGGRELPWAAMSYGQGIWAMARGPLS